MLLWYESFVVVRVIAAIGGEIGELLPELGRLSKGSAAELKNRGPNWGLGLNICEGTGTSDPDPKVAFKKIKC
jgi:hypothetical protein